MHVDNNYPLYNAEARQRMFYYPPPYWYGGSWYYVSPWLWIDGNKKSGSYPGWRAKIVARMNKPSPVTVTMWGNYTLSDGTGTVYAQFRNDSTATINGRVIWVITEDSLYYAAPNGDLWHNHVARDYLPNHNGQTVTIPAGDSVTLSQPFTIQPGWNVNRCAIITWIQNDVMQADSTKEIWQGGMIKVVDLGIKEGDSKKIVLRKVDTAPNPSVHGTNFLFKLPAGTAYSIQIFDITGSRVRSLNGISKGGLESVNWNRRDDNGTRVSAGVYLYEFKGSTLTASGKVVIE